MNHESPNLSFVVLLAKMWVLLYSRIHVIFQFLTIQRTADAQSANRHAVNVSNLKGKVGITKQLLSIRKEKGGMRIFAPKGITK